MTTLRMGNPQCVALVDELPDESRFQTLGPAISTHSRFAAGTNVEFARVESPASVRILIWERGVGPTLASGTGACAAAVAAIAHAGAARDVEVIAPGGSQRVEWREDGVSSPAGPKSSSTGTGSPVTRRSSVPGTVTRGFCDRGTPVALQFLRSHRR